MIGKIADEARFGSGQLLQIVNVLAANDVDLRALSIAETHEFGVLRFIADDEAKAVSVLREAGHVLSLTQVLAVVLKDEPGSFAETLRILAAEEIDVEYTYAFLTPKAHTACMIFRVADNAKAAAVLNAAGVRLATKEEMV